MKRLFVGLPVPPALAQRLRGLQPEASGRVRPVPIENMHLTLCFIGQAEIEPMLKALRVVKVNPFSLDFDHLGQFGSTRQGGILWLGAQTHPCLSTLYTLTTTSLAPLGVEPGARPFTPHITLARYSRNAPQRTVDRFLRQQLPPLPPLEVREFILYASNQTVKGAVYSREETYPLR